MKNYLQKTNQVSICDNKQNCIHATGNNADMIAKGATVMLLFLGIAALLRAASN